MAAHTEWYIKRPALKRTAWKAWNRTARKFGKYTCGSSSQRTPDAENV